MKAKENRTPRTYKILPKTYKKADVRAKKGKTTVATVVEQCVTAFANGFDIKFQKDDVPENMELGIF